MGNRTGINDVNQLYVEARIEFLNGIITGVPIGKNVSGVLRLAAAFGSDAADNGVQNFFAKIDCTDFDELKVMAVEEVVSRMFSGSISTAVHYIVTLGAAFGYQSVKAKQGVVA